MLNKQMPITSTTSMYAIVRPLQIRGGFESCEAEPRSQTKKRQILDISYTPFSEE
jgi:hypothetical protein